MSLKLKLTKFQRLKRKPFRSDFEKIEGSSYRPPVEIGLEILKRFKQEEVVGLRRPNYLSDHSRMTRLAYNLLKSI